MADNVVLNLGTGGDTVAADDVSGIKYQYVKLDAGADGVSAPVTSAAPLPTAQTGALPAGTNAIGKLAANSGVDIGDVDVTSLPAVTLAAAQTLATVTTVGTVTTVSTVTAVTGGGVASGASDSGNPIKVGGRYNSTPPTLTNGQRGDLQLDASGNAKVNVVSGTANLAAAATGGYTPFSFRSAASNNATNVKASAGTLGYLNAINTTATIYYLKLYNKASSPSPASDNALLVGVYPVPANTSGAGVAIPLPPQGMNFSTGISYALVAGLSDTDNTNAATGVCVNGGYA